MALCHTITVPVHRSRDQPLDEERGRRIVRAAHERLVLRGRASWGEAKAGGLVEGVLVQRDADGRVVEPARAVAEAQPSELERVVHDREVARLVVGVVVAPVAQPEVVAQLVHECPRLLFDGARALAGLGGGPERDQQVAAPDPARDAG